MGVVEEIGERAKGGWGERGAEPSDNKPSRNNLRGTCFFGNRSKLKKIKISSKSGLVFKRL